MALTNYCVYRWLIYLLEEETDEIHSITLEEINKRYKKDKQNIYGYDQRTGRTRGGLPARKIKLKDENGNILKDKNGKEIIEYRDSVIESKTFLNWRYSIYKQFGLLIQQPKFKNIIRNRYYLANPELLDDNKTLRETIDFLVNEETRGWEAKTLLTVSPRGRKKKVEGVESAMGYISTGSGEFGYLNPPIGCQDVPDMVGIIQFAMTIGEALVIDYCKVPSNKEKEFWNYKREDRFVLEPQQLLTVNGKWYVAGYLYKYGDIEKRILTIYDVDRIRLYDGDDEMEVPLYNLQDQFDIYNYLPSDWNDMFNPEKVMSAYLKVAGGFLNREPFCDAQEKTDIASGILHNVYKVYVKPDRNFFIQYMSYGEELQVFNPGDKVERLPIDITDEQIKYLKELRKRKL